MFHIFYEAPTVYISQSKRITCLNTTIDTNTTTDILVELSKEQIIALSQYYSQRQNDAPYMYSHLQTVLSWYEKTPNHEDKKIQIFAPEGGPDVTSGTFVSLAHFPLKIITTWTMQENSELLSKIFTTTKRFDYKKHTYLFYAIQERVIPVLDKIMADKSLTSFMHDTTERWLINSEEAISKVITYPPEYVLNKLKPTDCCTINDMWTFKQEKSEDYVSALIEYNGGWRMYTKTDHKLVGWILKSQLGQISNLQVINEHQKKGFAQALVNKLSKEISLDGFPASAGIIPTNEASKKLFAKCGFQCKCVAGFLLYK